MTDIERFHRAIDLLSEELRAGGMQIAQMGDKHPMQSVRVYLDIIKQSAERAGLPKDILTIRMSDWVTGGVTRKRAVAWLRLATDVGIIGAKGGDVYVTTWCEGQPVEGFVTRLRQWLIVEPPSGIESAELKPTVLILAEDIVQGAGGAYITAKDIAGKIRQTPGFESCKHGTVTARLSEAIRRHGRSYPIESGQEGYRWRAT